MDHPPPLPLTEPPVTPTPSNSQNDPKSGPIESTSSPLHQDVPAVKVSEAAIISIELPPPASGSVSPSCVSSSPSSGSTPLELIFSNIHVPNPTVKQEEFPSHILGSPVQVTTTPPALEDVPVPALPASPPPSVMVTVMNTHPNIPSSSPSSPTPPVISSSLQVLLQKVSTSPGVSTIPTTPSKPHPLILKGISGYAQPGQVLGIMGPSGSGKTTLLSTLSGRNRKFQGTITMNGEPLNKQLRRKICYVLQQDIFLTDLTLRQTLMYTARLRLPDHMTDANKEKHVNHIIEVLDLGHCQHTIIGDMMKRGLSGGEKKRVSIACELLTNPTVLLIDEPTSGLDSSTASSLLSLLKNFAVKEKKTVILTIHQPSSQIFYSLDNLLLLSAGSTAYFGPVNRVVPFFASVGLNMTPHYNPADFIMEHIKSGPDTVARILEAAKSLPVTPPVTTHHHHAKSSGKRVKIQSPDQRPSVAPSTASSASPTATTNTTGTTTVGSLASSSLWMGDEESRNRRLNSDASAELRVMIEDHHREEEESAPRARTRDCDSGRSSLTDMDRTSTRTYSSSSSSSSAASTCSDDLYLDYKGNEQVTPGSPDVPSVATSGQNGLKFRGNHTSSHHHNHHHHKHHQHQGKLYDDGKSGGKWPTGFWTQLRVLTERNFYEARGRMLSKLNFIQTICLALVTGNIWFQLERTEETLTDRKGWLFFSMTYWMLFALFNALVSFPSEREVINKERASGSYRLSSYYVAKMVGELPLTITMPTLFHVVSYPLLGCTSTSVFIGLWSFTILASLVAQSVGLLVGAACNDLEVSITISALYSMSSILFGGFYSATMPFWLQWVKYLSIVYYAFQNMQIIELSWGSPIRCSTHGPSRFDACKRGATWIPFQELSKGLDISSLNTEPLPFWFSTTILIMFLVMVRLTGYLVLRYIRRPK